VGLYVLDSTVLIDFLRGRPVVKRVEGLRDAGGVPATTAINVDEIVRGLRTGEEPAARSLFEGLAILPLGRRVGWRAGEWRREFAARGITLYQADCLVAGAAWVHKAVLVTGNPKDFPMEGVTVEHWPVGT
jgi:predicted nucleic acid-binding protein